MRLKLQRGGFFPLEIVGVTMDHLIEESGLLSITSQMYLDRIVSCERLRWLKESLRELITYCVELRGTEFNRRTNLFRVLGQIYSWLALIGFLR